jgi:hypothetical protein
MRQYIRVERVVGPNVRIMRLNLGRGRARGTTTGSYTSTRWRLEMQVGSREIPTWCSFRFPDQNFCSNSKNNKIYYK